MSDYKASKPPVKTRVSRTSSGPEPVRLGRPIPPLGMLPTGGMNPMLTKTRTATFIRHYVEMVVVMFAGMLVLGLPGEAALHAIGSGTAELRETAPATVFMGMAATMTLPMVAWMRYRGHTWQPTLEMAASMVIPTLAAIALPTAGLFGLHPLLARA